MVAPIIAQACLLLAGSALVVQHLVKPRLPVYVMTPVFSSLPRFHWHEGTTEVTTQVALFNENYLHMDVHALSFDLLAADRSGVLRHLGSIKDSQQSKIQAMMKEQQIEMSRQMNTNNYSSIGPNSNNTSIESTSSSLKNQAIKPPSPEILWSINARANFSQFTTIRISVNMNEMLHSLTALISRAWYGAGHLTLPTTGVAHIKASSHPDALKPVPKIPVTVSIICDNLLDTWTMKVHGLECTFFNLQPGWRNMTKTAATVRNYALKKLPANETGGILNHPNKTSWDDILRNIAWEEILHAFTS